MMSKLSPFRAPRRPAAAAAPAPRPWGLVTEDGTARRLGPVPEAVHVEEVADPYGLGHTWTSVTRVWRQGDLRLGSGCGLCPLGGCRAVAHASGLATCHAVVAGSLTDAEALALSLDGTSLQ